MRRGERYSGEPQGVLECVGEWERKRVTVGWKRTSRKWWRFGRRGEKDININKT